MVHNTKGSYPAKGWAPPSRIWSPKLPLNPTEIESASRTTEDARLLTKWGCLWGKPICALTHLFHVSGNSSGQWPPKSKEAFLVGLVRVWFEKQKEQHTAGSSWLWELHSCPLSAQLSLGVRSVQSYREIQQGDAKVRDEDLSPYLWPCKIDRTVIIKRIASATIRIYGEPVHPNTVTSFLYDSSWATYPRKLHLSWVIHLPPPLTGCGITLCGQGEIRGSYLKWYLPMFSYWAAVSSNITGGNYKKFLGWTKCYYSFCYTKPRTAFFKIYFIWWYNYNVVQHCSSFGENRFQNCSMNRCTWVL